MEITTLGPEAFDERASKCLDSTIGLAELTGSTKIRASHILLSLLRHDPSGQDALCKECLDGFGAKALANALRVRLDQAAVENDSAAPKEKFPESGLPRPGDFEESGMRVIQKALAGARDFGLGRITLDLLSWAVWAEADPIVEGALSGAGLDPGERMKIAVHLHARLTSEAAGKNGIEVFRNQHLNWDAFQDGLQEALQKLAPIAAERSITENDLLACLVRRSGSRFLEATDRMDLSRQKIMEDLDGIVPRCKREGIGMEKEIAEPRMGRLARRMLNEAARLAMEDRAQRIREEDLILSHLDRVADAPQNIFITLGIDPQAMREILRKDRRPRADGEADPWEGTMLRFSPTMQQAWSSLLPLSRKRRILDTDLILAIVAQPDALLVEALYVIGADVPAIRTNLKHSAGNPCLEPDPGGAVEITQDRISPFVSAVIEDSRLIALREGCDAVCDSQVVRAHMARVVADAANLYERLGINTLKLNEALGKRTKEMKPGGQSEGRGQQEPVIRDIEGYIDARVISQPHAVKRAARALRRMRSGLSEPGQVVGKFLFLGPTGVGKTELARSMADIAFGTKPGKRDAYIIKIDCGNFRNTWDIVQLIGAAQGLKGYKEGQLTNGLREKPRAIILFDEAEKAHRDVWQSLLPLFDEGLVREADGTVYDATGCIVVATSNVGYKEAIEETDAFRRNWGEVREEVQSLVYRALKNYFSPEFIGRFGSENILYFNHFSKEDYRTIFRLQLKQIVDEMKGNKIALRFDNLEEVNDLFTELAWAVRSEGARPVRRLITELVRDPIILAREDRPERSTFTFVAPPGAQRLALQGE
jgi:hypothetical protein